MSWSVGAGLEGKGVVVTGAAGGIGREVARAFATAAARVCAVDLHQEAADEIVASFDGEGPHLAVGLDLCDLAAQEPLLRRAKDAFGGLYALAHCAAVLRRRNDIEEVTEEDWDVQLDTNLKVAFFLNRTAARLMREQGEGGRIVNFTSQGWWTGGFGGSVVYSASKGGIVSMTRGLARTFAPCGITVNAVSPGAVDTAMMRSGLTDEQLQAQVSAIPIGRIASPQELAGTVVFLASRHASYITGATINVSGGWLMY